MSEITIRQLVAAGVHFGHRRRFWNPGMEDYIHTTYQKVDIINPQKTLQALKESCQYLQGVTARTGRVLFVGTKRVSSGIIKEQATRAGMPYINHRWLGGTLTNWKTIRGSIQKLEQLEAEIKGSSEVMTKKELLKHTRAAEKLRINLEGIRSIGGLPTALYVVDVRHEAIAVSEAHKMGIPVVAMVDTNSSPDNITRLIPANDDSQQSIELITGAIADACAAGVQQGNANLKGAAPAETIDTEGGKVEVIRSSGAGEAAS